MRRDEVIRAVCVAVLMGTASIGCSDESMASRQGIDPLAMQPAAPPPDSTTAGMPAAPITTPNTDVGAMTPPVTDPLPVTPDPVTPPADPMTPAMDGEGMGEAGMGAMPDPAMSGSCRPADSVDADGPYTPTHIEDGHGGSWVFYPEELGADGMTHPVFVWGPGAGTGPSNYRDHLNRLASHGFVVISQPSSGSGGPETAELDWLLGENDNSSSPFYQKLDPNRVGMGGHSLGSLTTMAMADDPRLSLYVLVCGGCMSGRGGCGAADIHGPTVILGGDGDIGTPNYDADYEEIQSPVVFLTKDSTGHIDCARNNLSPWVAFMRWQFCGEDQWQPDFFDGGEYCSSPWECRSKNF
ncbi:MAG: hypothetical protein OXT09_14495 [Myxococcales bacterium]|nr:hypothetical protein [Myxococcales bacterium]